MDSNKKPTHRLFVGSAEWPSDLSDEETAGLYVEIKLDGERDVHRTTTQNTPCWDEDLKITGDKSSIISVEIKNGNLSTNTEISCIARVEISLEALLELCADDSSAALEFTPVDAKSGMGIITLELCPLENDPIELVTSTASLQNDDHMTANVENYILTIGAAEWTDTLVVDESKGFYVNVKLDDGRTAHKTNVTESLDAPCWDEELRIPGDPFSIIHFEIMQTSSEASDTDWCIGRAKVYVEALLTMCADNEFAALEITMITESQAPEVSFLTVKLRKLVDPIDLDRLALKQISCFWRLGDSSNLENAIANFREAAKLTHDGHPNKPERLFNLGNSWRIRFQCLRELSDLDSAIENFREAVQLTDDEHPGRPDYLTSLGGSQLNRFQLLSESSDLESVILNLRNAIRLTDDTHPNKPDRLSNLSISQKIRFQHSRELSDLESSIVNLRKAVELTGNGHPSKPGWLINLGINQKMRFDHLGDLSDLDNAIASLQEATELTGNGNPDKVACLGNLGISQVTRFGLLGELSDLENGIANFRQAVQITDDRHPERPGRLSNLGASHRLRFERLGELLDLDGAIANLREAIDLTSDGHPDKAGRLANLGISQRNRFEHLHELSDLESAITNEREAVKLTNDGHPEKPSRLINLSISQQTRFDYLGEFSDLDNAIANLREAIELIGDDSRDKLACLCNLGNSQKARFDHLGELADLDDAIANLREAVELTGSGNRDKISCLCNLGSSQQRRFERLGELYDLNNAIANLREAIKLTGDGSSDKLACLCNLGNSQQIRFEHLGELSDLESAIANFRQAAKLTDDGHPDKPDRLCNLGNSQRIRFQRLRELSDLESAITNLRQAINLTDKRHSDKLADRLSNLGISQEIRFQHFGELSDLESSIVNLRQAVELTGNGHPEKLAGRLSNLGNTQHTRFRRLGDLLDLESAIANLQEALDLTDDRHPHKPGRLSNLGLSQRSCFERLGELADLESSITNLRRAVELTGDEHPGKPGYLAILGICQHTRFECLGELPDRMAAIASMKSAAQSPVAFPRQALAAARYWAQLSQIDDPSSTLDAYRTAIEILPQVAWLGLDTLSRQRWLLKEQPESLGCLAATCAIQLGRFEEAIELLDLARSVFWQQASLVRSDPRDLRRQHPELASQLERVSQALDANSFSYFSLLVPGTELHQDQVQEHRRLVFERNSLVERVRQLPGFEFFLKPIPFHQLRSTATGQVIIINISPNGADALIFDDIRPIRHVPLPDVDMEMLTEYSGDILLKRSSAATRLQKKSYLKQYLRPALRAVGKCIIEHVFNALHIPLQGGTAADPPCRRIFWYPTGPLTFIPIHAVGIGGTGFDVSRLVISSYVTTLGSLFQAQKRHSESVTECPKLLAVSQPNTPRGWRPLPKSKAEVEQVIRLISEAGWLEEDIEHLNDIDATVDRVSNALDTCSWVHLACHGLQDQVGGMKSAFALHDQDLDLVKIASKRLSFAQFAFLSACHAASGLRNLPGEAMHLAAGIQFAGFSSVIATMWSICDEDAPKVAEHTYRYLLRNGVKGVDVSESAAALNYAVLRLREDPTVTVDRWAPFIHFGL